MKKILPIILFSVLLLFSCSIDRNDDGDYYDNLLKQCGGIGMLGHDACESSVKGMRESGYREPEKTNSGYLCPQGTELNGYKSIGAIWWCEPTK